MMHWINYFHPLKKLHRSRDALTPFTQFPQFMQKNINWRYPDLEDEAKALEYICLDLETTGLDVNSDSILSIGWVTIKDFQIDLGSATQLMIKDTGQVSPKTAVINHITPEMLNEGCTLDEAIRDFFIQAQGKVIVAHACFVEKAFLDSYMQQRFHLSPMPLMWLDTLRIEKHLCRYLGAGCDNDLQLASIRERYALPEYNAHDALTDSIATAELLLAQVKRVYRDGKSCFGRLYRVSHS